MAYLISVVIMQINVANVDPVTGVYTKTSTTYALCGYIRAQVCACHELGLPLGFHLMN